MRSWKTRYRAFHIWQLRPYNVGPLPEEWHDCCTCHTHFLGRYCPNCGQSAKIGRYSFKSAILHFLDVWGMGNRGMFHTLHDLILRPGYMIRDYLSGMQNAYFPPFKLFFVLTTISLLVSSGLNLQMKNFYAQEKEESFELVEALKKGVSESGKLSENNILTQSIEWFITFQDHYPNLFSLSVLTFLSLLLYWLFRRCPAIPDLRYSEFYVALIWTNNMYSLYVIALGFLALGEIGNNLEFILLPIMLIPLKQLTGYSWTRIIFYSLITLVICFTLLIIMIIVFAFILAKTEHLLD